jgi:hypothetical protein
MISRGAGLRFRRLPPVGNLFKMFSYHSKIILFTLYTVRALICPAFPIAFPVLFLPGLALDYSKPYLYNNVK